MFMTSPFDGVQEHAEKVKECAWAFQQAMECYGSSQCTTFEQFRKDAIKLEREADAIKRRIRGHIPIGTLMPVDKFQLFRYLKEQDKVLDSVEDALDWISYRPEPGIPAELRKDFFLLVDAIIDPIEELTKMVVEARIYFKNYSEKQLNELEGHYTRTGKQMNLRLGIDLALAQLIMEAHDGYVDFKRDNEGTVSLGLVFGNIATEAQGPG